jgi:hypothetical protein
VSLEGYREEFDPGYEEAEEEYDYFARPQDVRDAVLHGYFVIEDGNHVDGFYDDYPDRLRPILACYRAAFEALEETVEGDKPLPPGGFLAVPEEGDVVNQCSLEEAT